MKLPQGLPQTLQENAWASIIEPVINNPANNSVLLKNVELIAGSNVINHKLQRKLVGWKTTRVRAAAQIYDDQDNNRYPQLTLILISDTNVVVDLECF